jgi:hypothetical protein
MQELTAKRTLVKSPPELWSELSELERLGRHLGPFGEITITKLEPEHTVAWEGEGASGTVSIEPSGWGTRVTLAARIAGEPASTEPLEEPEPALEPELAETQATEEAQPVRRRRFFAALMRRLWPEIPEPLVEAPAEQEPEPEPVVEEPPVAEPQPVPPEDGSTPLDRDTAQAVLEQALEALGSAHHRPFSRG